MPPKQEAIHYILELLDKSESYSPQALLLELQNKGINQADAKETLSYLIHDEQVELTSSSSLRRLEGAAA